jgi:hypothetical protein
LKRYRGGGTLTNCEINGPDDPLEATYVLAMDYANWEALHDGYDAQRTVMYCKILLEDGSLRANTRLRPGDPQLPGAIANGGHATQEVRGRRARRVGDMGA